MQNKKIDEIEYMECFLANSVGKMWKEQYGIQNYNSSEEPDFIFSTKNGKKVGMEIVQFIIKSKHGFASQALMRTGNKICKYVLDKYNFKISIIIDKYDKKKWEIRTRYDFFHACHNPGFVNRFNEKDIKAKIERIIDRKIEELRNFPCLLKEWIEVDEEKLCFSISAYPNIHNRFDCVVNNECFSFEDPFDELQKAIDKKNEKYDRYIKNCDQCFLLIYKPEVSKGNYCHFTDKIVKQKFISKFENVFLYDAQNHKCFELCL